MNWAVNREALSKDIMKGLAVPSTSPFAPTGTAGYNPNIKGYSLDPAKAKALLAEAGYEGLRSSTSRSRRVRSARRSPSR